MATSSTSSTTPSGPPPPLEILIVGGGIAGLAVALALAKFLPLSSTNTQPRRKITVFEVRPSPSTIGGAVNLTPNALRYLGHLGVLPILKSQGYGTDVGSIELFNIYGGGKVGELDFSGPTGRGFGEPPYRAMRIARGDLLLGLLQAVENGVEGVELEVRYGKKCVGVVEEKKEEREGGKVSVNFEDGTTARGDLLLGCDGIHSAVRMMHVEPERKPVYSGIAVAYGFANISKASDSNNSNSNISSTFHVPFKDTSVFRSRRGSFLASFCEPTRRERMYVGAVMEVAEVPASSSSSAREGWKARGADQDAVRRDIAERFAGKGVESVEALLRQVPDWYLYPVHKLPPRGRWSTGRVMLLGDAAHAMVPQGESIGMAFEDVVVFARLMANFSLPNPTNPTPSTNLSATFQAYESHRRARIDAAYDEATWRWESMRDSGWLAMKIQDWLTPAYLWWSRRGREEGFEMDVAVTVAVAVIGEEEKEEEKEEGEGEEEEGGRLKIEERKRDELPSRRGWVREGRRREMGGRR